MSKLIKWGYNDRINLQKAVNNFNAKIKRLEEKGYENLPSKVSYKALRGWGSNKDEILTRKELNDTIRSLKKFTKRGREREVVLPSGQTITRWENMEINLMQKRASKVLDLEIKELSKKREFGLGNKEIQQKQKQLESIMNLKNKSGYRYKIGLDALRNVASFERETKLAKDWYDNFMYALDEMKNYDNIDVLKEKLENFKDPNKAWEYISQSESLKDLFLWYKEKASARTYGGYKSNQEALDKALVELGLNIWI